MFAHSLSCFHIGQPKQRQRQGAEQQEAFETQLKQIKRQLKMLDRQHRQLLHSVVIEEFTTDEVKAESNHINKARETLIAQSAELETQLKAGQEAVVNIPKLESYVRDIQQRLPELDFEGKRLALDMLGITVWLNGDNVEITGIIEPEKQGVGCSSDCYDISSSPPAEKSRVFIPALKWKLK